MPRIEKYANFKGQRFGRLVVISEPFRKNKMRHYLCRCDCGTVKEVRADALAMGRTLSCGCYQKEVIKYPKTQFRKQNEYEVIENVAYVKLTNSDKIMLCDIEDWEKLKDHCWVLDGDGYAITHLHVESELESKKAHIVITGKKPGYVTDHINRNRLDNRKENLRLVTQHANTVNSSLSKNNTSGIKGVYLRNKSKKKWMAALCFNGKNICLGYFATKEEAAEARHKAEEKYFLPLFEDSESVACKTI